MRHRVLSKRSTAATAALAAALVFGGASSALTVACTGQLGGGGAGDRDAAERDEGPSAAVDSEQDCQAVAPVVRFFQTECVNCHKPGGSYPSLQATDMPSLVTAESEGKPGTPLVVPGKANDSWLYEKLVGTHDVGSLMPLGSDTPLPGAGTVQTWIDAGAPTTCEVDDDGTIVETDPNGLDPVTLFTCQADAVLSSPARLRRIEPDQWARATYEDSMQQVPFLAGEGHRYSTYAAGESVDGSTLLEVFRVLPRLGGSWTDNTGNPYPRLSVMRYGPVKEATTCFQMNHAGSSNPDPSDECVERFITALLEHGVYFRKPTQAEVDSLVTFAKARVAEEQVETDRGLTIRLIVQAAWLTPGAMFHSERGGEVGDDGRSRLTPEEVGRALSHVFDVSAPGQSIEGYGTNAVFQTRLPDIRAAMNDGSILDDDVIDRIVRRHLAGGAIEEAKLVVDGEEKVLPPPEGPSKNHYGNSASDTRPYYVDAYWMSEGLRGFFRQWLGYSNKGAIFKDTPQATSAQVPRTDDHERLPNRFEKAIGQAYGRIDTELMDNLIARVVVSDENVLAELLTTRLILTPESPDQYVLDLLGLPGTPDDYTTLEARWATVPEGTRAGVLTHPVWLAAHSLNFENDPNPVHRGKWVRENLLCETIPDIPITVDAMLDSATKDQSTRARMAAQIDSNDQCSYCHQLMNPLGYTFEIYNHAGYLRSTDHGADPSGAATLARMPDGLDGDVADAIELMEKLATSQTVERCFVRQVFRYFMGRNENAADACTLVAMESSYEESGGSMVSMLVTLFQSDSFLYRHIPTEEQP